MPAIRNVSVAEGDNRPGIDRFADNELSGVLQALVNVVMCRLTVYFGPNNSSGLIGALAKVVTSEPEKPAVMLITWGASEDEWSPGAVRIVNGLIKHACRCGITVCCAAGDKGSDNGDCGAGRHRVIFPASSPYAIAVGGSSLTEHEATAAMETVWNNDDGWATGGGVSELFARPKWQKCVGIPPSANPPHFVGRGVPDVAAHADLHRPYKFLNGGADVYLGGTSIAAAIWAALIARIAQHVGRPLGHLNPLLYELGAKGIGFNPIVEGNNGGYSAGPGWNPCCGWGSPKGTDLLEHIQAAIDAGWDGTKVD